MFYNNQPPYPQHPDYQQNPEQPFPEPQHQGAPYQERPFQEPSYQQNPYPEQPFPETQHQGAPYQERPFQEPSYQQTPYPEQPFLEPQHQGAPYQEQKCSYQQPHMYQSCYGQRVTPQTSMQPQTLPAEPTQQQIQQTVGTQFLSLKKPVLDFVKPWVEYGMAEAKQTSEQHAMTEIAAIMFLIGKGFNPTTAHYIVESWEKDEQF